MHTKLCSHYRGSAVPNFISVFAFDSFRGYALGLSAVEGMTLRQYFETEAPTIELLHLVWSQLRALHDCGVAHVDIQAENALIQQVDA
jgi:tRNA A-37 threonylcarbamoyl transferase component Bud32